MGCHILLGLGLAFLTVSSGAAPLWAADPSPDPVADLRMTPSVSPLAETRDNATLRGFLDNDASPRLRAGSADLEDPGQDEQSDVPLRGSADLGHSQEEPAETASEPNRPKRNGPERKTVERKGNALFDKAVAAYDAGEHETAFTIWRRLADQTDLAAMRNVAYMLRNGIGVTQDLRKARRYYRRAAELGYPAAMVNLGQMILEGEGGKADPKSAARYFYRAARLGSHHGQFHLARLLETGNGVGQDIDAAFAYYQAAASLGHEDAIAAVDRLRSEGTILPAFSAKLDFPGLETADTASNAPRKDVMSLLRGTGLPENDEIDADAAENGPEPDQDGE